MNRIKVDLYSLYINYTISQYNSKLTKKKKNYHFNLKWRGSYSYYLAQRHL
jgi:hypothetical protein